MSICEMQDECEFKRLLHKRKGMEGFTAYTRGEHTRISIQDCTSQIAYK